MSCALGVSSKLHTRWIRSPHSSRHVSSHPRFLFLHTAPALALVPGTQGFGYHRLPTNKSAPCPFPSHALLATVPVGSALLATLTLWHRPPAGSVARRSRPSPRPSVVASSRPSTAVKSRSSGGQTGGRPHTRHAGIVFPKFLEAVVRAGGLSLPSLLFFGFLLPGLCPRTDV